MTTITQYGTASLCTRLFRWIAKPKSVAYPIMAERVDLATVDIHEEEL